MPMRVVRPTCFSGFVRPDRGGQRNCGRVRAASTKSCYIFFFIYTLKTSDNNNPALVELFMNSFGPDALYSCLHMLAVGDHSNLAAG